VPDEELLEYFDIDTRSIFAGPPDNFKPKDLGEDFYEDEWGVIRYCPPEGYYFDLYKVPFDGEPTLDDIEQFLWPDPDDPGRIRRLRERTEYLHNKTDYAVVLSLGATVLHTSQYMRGFEGWFLDMALRQDFMGALMDKIVDVHVRTIRNIFHEIDGDMVDIAYIADDIAGDRGLMFSPESYRTILKPRTKKIIDQIKEFTDAKIMYHTCGAVHSLINDLIEIGVDILNPVQTSATGMDTKRLKNDFGDKISFWGGIDTRRVLPRGTVEEVREEVKNVIRNLAPGGGYVLNFVHNAQPDVKPENICEMFEAGKKYGKYPLELQ
jgi:uroporphyrinogen decarboxylase